jgi:acyl-CoA dehydrogenase
VSSNRHSKINTRLIEKLGYTRSGMGELVEKIYREVPGSRIPGGSEDVMLDLSVRQLIKNYKAKTKALETSAGAKL